VAPAGTASSSVVATVAIFVDARDNDAPARRRPSSVIAPGSPTPRSSTASAATRPLDATSTDWPALPSKDAVFASAATSPPSASTTDAAPVPIGPSGPYGSTSKSARAPVARCEVAVRVMATGSSPVRLACVSGECERAADQR
jgi:hypothetical protein